MIIFFVIYLIGYYVCYTVGRYCWKLFTGKWTIADRHTWLYRSIWSWIGVGASMFYIMFDIKNDNENDDRPADW